MNEIAEKLQKVDGGKLNAAAVALLTLVLFVFGNQMRALPEKIEAMAITQKLLVYRIERLEEALQDQRTFHDPANKAPMMGAPSTASAGAIVDHFHSLGDRDAAAAFDFSQPLPVGFEFDHIGAREFVRQIIDTRLGDPDRFQRVIPTGHDILQPCDLLPGEGRLVAAALEKVPVIEAEVLRPALRHYPPALL